MEIGRTLVHAATVHLAGGGMGAPGKTCGLGRRRI